MSFGVLVGELPPEPPRDHVRDVKHLSRFSVYCRAPHAHGSGALPWPNCGRSDVTATCTACEEWFQVSKRFRVSGLARLRPAVSGCGPALMCSARR